jgi:DNA repair exonuclease SbcCD ATPase subunit
MRIKSLELSNFRGFLGKHSIDFAYKGDQNLTLILAENEVGKSTILNAFVWCFYGRLTDDTDLKNELVHDEAKTTKAYVQISIVHDDKEFQFKRIHDKGNEELFGWEIDNVDQIHKVHFPESIIKTFLPPELSDYFLFNGEGLKDIIKDSVKLEKSIQDIQGLTAASAALESLESYKKTLLQEAKKLTKKGTENEEKKKKLKSAQKDEESAKNKKKEADRKYDETEEAFKIAEKAWGLVKNSDAKSLKEQRDESQKRLSAINKELINLQNRKKDLIRKYGIDILGFTFTETAQKKLKEAGDIGYPSKFHKTIINDSLADDECKLCERSFKKEPSVKEKLKEKLTLSFDGDLQDRLGLVHGSIGTSLIAIQEFTIEIDQINLDISGKQIEKDEEKSKFELLQAQISALTVDDSEVRKAEKNFNDANLKKISAARNQGIYENEYKTKKYIADKLFGEVQRIVETNASDEFKSKKKAVEILF